MDQMDGCRIGAAGKISQEIVNKPDHMSLPCKIGRVRAYRKARLYDWFSDHASLSVIFHPI